MEEVTSKLNPTNKIRKIVLREHVIFIEVKLVQYSRIIEC